MKIDNQKNTYRIWLSRLIMTIVFTLIILLIVFLPWFDQTEFWLTKYHVAIFISAVYIIVNWINYFGTQHYLIVHQNFRGKVAIYPRISLSALDKKNLENMLHSLDKYVIPT